MIEVSEIYRTRTVLFELMAIDLAKKATDDHIVLEAILERMRAAAAIDDVIAFSWLSVEFHDKDTRASGNLTAKRIHDSLLLRTLAIRRLSLALLGRMAKSLEDHTQLVKAHQNHDSNLAGAIMRANHNAALAALERHFQQTGALRFADVAADPAKAGADVDAMTPAAQASQGARVTRHAVSGEGRPRSSGRQRAIRQRFR